jgi:hypothetical protein
MQHGNIHGLPDIRTQTLSLTCPALSHYRAIGVSKVCSVNFANNAFINFTEVFEKFTKHSFYYPNTFRGRKYRHTFVHTFILRETIKGF